MKRKIYSLLFILFVFPVLVFAQTLEQKLAEIDAYAEKTRADWNIPGMAIAIVKDDKVVFAKGYGVRELGKTDKVDENTLFAIASNSKAFMSIPLVTSNLIFQRFSENETLLFVMVEGLAPAMNS